MPAPNGKVPNMKTIGNALVVLAFAYVWVMILVTYS